MPTIQLRTDIPGPRSQALMKRRQAAVVHAAYHATPVFIAKDKVTSHVADIRFVSIELTLGPIRISLQSVPCL